MSEKAVDPGLLRLGGIGGLVFAGCVLAANGARGEPPLAGAEIADVLRYYTQHRTALQLSQAVFGLDVAFLLLFATVTFERIGRVERARPLARLGMSMVLVMVATFGAMLALDVTLTASASLLEGSHELATILWRLHTTAMVVNGVVMGCALGFFARAAWIAGVGPRWLAIVGQIGAVCGLLGAVPAVPIVLGSPLGLLGLACFLAWLTFVVGMSVSHLRASSPASSRALATA